MKKKILIIEDDLDIVGIYSTALTAEGFEVMTSENGEQELEKALDEKPDLILSDILMPVMDGLTMLQKLRDSGDYGKNAQVFLLTNLSADNEDITKKIPKSDLVNCIVKNSVTIKELIEKIKQRLAHT